MPSMFLKQENELEVKYRQMYLYQHHIWAWACMHLHHYNTHNETQYPITSTAVTLDFLLYQTGGDDLKDQ